MPQIAAALPNIAKIAQVGSAGYGLYNSYKQNQYQNQLRNLAMNPAAMAEFAKGYTQPLNGGLQKGVANEAQAYLAERGLSSSPQISQQVESQAIAPYIQQNQQYGYENALRALGLGGGAIPPAQQQQNSQTGLAQILSMLKGGGGINSDTFGSLMNSGRVQPVGIDMSSLDPTALGEGDMGSPGLDMSSLFSAPLDLNDWNQSQPQNYGG